MQAQPSMGTASTTLRPTGEPRNRARKEEVGGAQPTVLESFHLNPACVCNSITPHKASFGAGV